MQSHNMFKSLLSRHNESYMDWITALDTMDFSLLGGAFLVPLFVLFAKLTKGNSAANQNSKKWPTVNATITSSTIKEQIFYAVQRKIIGWKNVDAYTPAVAYKYSYKGKKYTGTKLSPVKTISSNKGVSEKIINQYPAGKIVSLYINPKKPSQSYLEPKNMMLHSLLIGGLFSVAFPLIAISVIYLRHTS